MSIAAVGSRRNAVLNGTNEENVIAFDDIYPFQQLKISG